MTVISFIKFNILKKVSKTLTLFIGAIFSDPYFSAISKWLHVKSFSPVSVFFVYLSRFTNFSLLKHSPYFSRLVSFTNFTISAFSQALPASFCMRSIKCIHCKLYKTCLIDMTPIFNLYFKFCTFPTFVC